MSLAGLLIHLRVRGRGDLGLFSAVAAAFVLSGLVVTRCRRRRFRRRREAGKLERRCSKMRVAPAVRARARAASAVKASAEGGFAKCAKRLA